MKCTHLLPAAALGLAGLLAAGPLHANPQAASAPANKPVPLQKAEKGVEKAEGAVKKGAKATEGAIERGVQAANKGADKLGAKAGLPPGSPPPVPKEAKP